MKIKAHTGSAPQRALVAVNDARRTMKPRHIMQWAGTPLMRFGWKTFIPVSAAMLAYLSLGKVANDTMLGEWIPLLQNENTNPFKALATPLLWSGSLIGMGMSLKYLPSLLFSSRVGIAEGNDLNLLKDYKVKHLDRYITRLWDHVYAHEAAMQYTPCQIRQEQEQLSQVESIVRSGITPLAKEGFAPDTLEEMITNALIKTVPEMRPGKSKEGFALAVKYIIQNKDSQTEEFTQTGFRLSALENVLDGPPLHWRNTKIDEIYNNSRGIKNAKVFRKPPVHKKIFGALGFVSDNVSANMLYKFTTHEFARQVGAHINAIRKVHPNVRINAENIVLADGHDYDYFVPEVQEKIIAARQSLLQSHGKDATRINRVIRRMWAPKMQRAIELRASIDPEYCVGSLNDSLVQDCIDLDTCDDSLLKARCYESEIQHEQGILNSYLAAHCTDYTLEQQRALKMAYHVDHKGVAALIKHGNHNMAQPIIEEVTGEPAKYSHMLIAVRTHHQLALDEYELHKELIFALGDKQ